MREKVSIVVYSDESFSSTLDLLIEKARYNPIYSSRFDMFYSEISAVKANNISSLILINNEPICGLLLNYKSEPNGKISFDYFGRPAALISRLDSSSEILDQASSALRDHLKNKKYDFWQNSESSGIMRVSDSRIVQCNFVQQIVRNFHRVETRFSQFVDLTKDEIQIKSDYSKSVKSEIRNKARYQTMTQIIDTYSSSELISNAVGKLKEMHFASAGRITRSNKSWNIQEDLIAQGNAFIVQMELNHNIESSAFFMSNGYSCYYGVSASKPKSKGQSYSHLCVADAIDYSKKKGLKTFYLGDQYSSLSRELDTKEKNIEKFKSFFGGRLKLELEFFK